MHGIIRLLTIRKQARKRMITLNNDWDEFLLSETQKPYYIDLRAFLKKEYSTKQIYPAPTEIFNALKYTPYANVKAVILGQDPYINPGEAHGLAFSVQDGAAVPPSLKNIFKELHNDLGVPIPQSGCLVKWAEQGVMLLNAALTVQASRSRSHVGKGWEKFTAAVISRLNDRETPMVFMLWGKDAAAKAEMVTNSRHLVLTAAHPSPLAGGRFFGCRHFSKANAFLTDNNIGEINWNL